MVDSFSTQHTLILAWTGTFLILQFKYCTFSYIVLVRNMECNEQFQLGKSQKPELAVWLELFSPARSISGRPQSQHFLLILNLNVQESDLEK